MRTWVCSREVAANLPKRQLDYEWLLNIDEPEMDENISPKASKKESKSKTKDKTSTDKAKSKTKKGKISS